MRHNDHVYLAMRDIIEGPEGTKAAVDAIKCGRPPLSGVDPILQAKLGPRYQRKDDKYDPPGEAGFIVVKYMESLGYVKKPGKNGSCVEGCVAKTGKMFYPHDPA